MTASTALTSAWVLPGQPLPSAPSTSSTVVAASGSYARSNFIFSSSTGQPSYIQPAAKKKSSSSSSTGIPIQVNVSTPLRPLLRLPEPESIVLARVTRITSRQAMCSILLVLPDPGSTGTATSAIALNLSQSLASGAANHAAGEDPSGLDFSGVIRQQDVRLTETDKVKMAECFRVGDLVKAKVVSVSSGTDTLSRCHRWTDLFAAATYRSRWGIPAPTF
jgi:exosome complex component CSL4